MSEINNNYGLNDIGMGKGIRITTGFDLGAQVPLDSRIVVKNMTDLKAMPKDKIYLGLLVHVIEDNKLYQWKYNLDENGELSKEPDWGPIEAEVSTKDISNLSEINFANTPSLQLQKNKNDFFPIVHEKYVYDNSATTLPNKYQTKTDGSLKTTDKTIVGAINEIYSGFDDAVSNFEEVSESTITRLEGEINTAKDKMLNDLEAIQKDLSDQSEELSNTITQKTDEMNALITSTQNKMDKLIADKQDEMNDLIQETKDQFEEQINEMTSNLSNVIMSSEQITDLMAKINKNISDLAAL